MNGSPVVKKIPANKKDRYLLKTGIYVRVSSGKVEQLRSLSAQASALTRYVYFRENWVLKDMYIEVGSAKPGSSRREFSRLIEDCKDHKIENVVVKSLSRFSRDTEEAIESIRTLVKAGVDVYLLLQQVSRRNSIASGRAGRMPLLRSVPIRCWTMPKLLRMSTPGTQSLTGTGKRCTLRQRRVMSPSS